MFNPHKEKMYRVTLANEISWFWEIPGIDLDILASSKYKCKLITGNSLNKLYRGRRIWDTEPEY